MDWYHPQRGLLGASQPFTLNDIQYPGDWLRLAADEDRAALGFIPVVQGPRPDDKLFYVGETNVTVVDGVAHVNYASTPRDPADVARAAALEQIANLERSITDRMWREDAKGCTDVMDFGVDDPRTGKTATQYIAWVDDCISVARTAL